MGIVNARRIRPTPSAFQFTDLSIRTWATLDSAILKARQDACYRLWHVARAIDEPGSGLVPVKAIREAIKQLDLSGLSDGQLSRLLEKGSGVFWAVFHRRGRGRWLRLAGIERLIDVFGLHRTGAIRWVTLPKTLAGWRAALTFSQAKPSRPISHAVLGSLAGRTSRTSRTYRRRLRQRLTTERNYIEGKRAIPLPNSYTALFAERSNPGMTRRINIGRYPLTHDPRGEQCRLFYDSRRDYRQIGHRFHRFRENDSFFVKWKHGWTHYVICNGRAYTPFLHNLPVYNDL